MTRFKHGQIVEITRIDEGDLPGWLGFRAMVANAHIDNTPLAIVEGQLYTKLLPLADRPDAASLNDKAYDEYYSPRAWFFWPTDDLVAVSDAVQDEIYERVLQASDLDEY